MGVTRRDFIRAGAIAGAGLMARGASAQSTDAIRTAVIGCRNRGHQVATSFLESGQFTLETMCDCDTAMIERGLKEMGTALPKAPKQVRDFRRVLDDPEIDAVIIATPDHWHGVMTRMALDAGKHVYLEKPASHSIRDGLAMVAAQERHRNRVVLVGTQQRSGAHFREAKQFIREGGLGKVGFARAWITHDRDILPKVPDSAPPESLDYDLWLGPAPEQPYNENRVHYVWRFIRDFGTGEMGNWGAHWLDIVHWFLELDYPVAAMGVGGQYVTHDAKEWPDTQTVLYEYPELTVLWELRLWTGFGTNRTGNGAEFGGDKGSLIITRRGWTFFPKDGEPVEHGSSEMEVAHAVNFADAIRNGAAPAATMADGHKSAAMCHMGNICTALNRRIAFHAATQDFGPDAEANALMGRPPRTPWTLES